MDAPLRQLLFPYGCTVTTVIDPVWMYRNGSCPCVMYNYGIHCRCVEVQLQQLFFLRMYSNCGPITVVTLLSLYACDVTAVILPARGYFCVCVFFLRFFFYTCVDEWQASL